MPLPMLSNLFPSAGAAVSQAVNQGLFTATSFSDYPD